MVSVSRVPLGAPNRPSSTDEVVGVAGVVVGVVGVVVGVVGVVVGRVGVGRAPGGCSPVGRFTAAVTERVCMSSSSKSLSTPCAFSHARRGDLTFFASNFPAAAATTAHRKRDTQRRRMRGTEKKTSRDCADVVGRAPVTFCERPRATAAAAGRSQNGGGGGGGGGGGVSWPAAAEKSRGGRRPGRQTLGNLGRGNVGVRPASRAAVPSVVRPSQLAVAPVRRAQRHRRPIARSSSSAIGDPPVRGPGAGRGGGGGGGFPPPA